VWQHCRRPWYFTCEPSSFGSGRTGFVWVSRVWNDSADPKSRQMRGSFRTEPRIPVEARFSTLVQTGQGPPSLLHSGYRFFPGGKVAGSWRWPPTPSSAEIKEGVELYIYSSGSLPPVIGWILPLPLHHWLWSRCKTRVYISGCLNLHENGRRKTYVGKLNQFKLPVGFKRVRRQSDAMHCDVGVLNIT
jgi:hypothetical protein